MTQTQLKRWFITPYIVVMVGVLSHILSVLWRQGPDLAWTGAALAGLASVGTFAGFILMGKARTRPKLPTLTWGAGLGTFLALLGVMTGGSLLALIYAGGVYGLGEWVYVYWYSRFGRRPSERLRPGAVLPDFELIENSGQRLRSRDLRESRPSCSSFAATGVRCAWPRSRRSPRNIGRLPNAAPRFS